MCVGARARACVCMSVPSHSMHRTLSPPPLCILRTLSLLGSTLPETLHPRPPLLHLPASRSSPFCPKSALHTSAEEKPITSMMRWKAPATVDGKAPGRIYFQTLIKRGGANAGMFYYAVCEETPCSWCAVLLIEETPAPLILHPCALRIVCVCVCVCV